MISRCDLQSSPNRLGDYKVKFAACSYRTASDNQTVISTVKSFRSNDLSWFYGFHFYPHNVRATRDETKFPTRFLIRF